MTYRPIVNFVDDRAPKHMLPVNYSPPILSGTFPKVLSKDAVAFWKNMSKTEISRFLFLKQKKENIMLRRCFDVFFQCTCDIEDM